MDMKSLREVYINQYKETIKFRYQIKAQEDRSKKIQRHNDKIKKKSAELVELLNAGNTLVHVAEHLNLPETFLETDYSDEHKPNWLVVTPTDKYLRYRFIPTLERISQIDFLKSKLKLINYYRKIFIHQLYMYFWEKDDDPRGTPFILFIVDALEEADDPLEFSTVEGIVKQMPLKHFKKNPNFF